MVAWFLKRAPNQLVQSSTISLQFLEKAKTGHQVLLKLYKILMWNRAIMIITKCKCIPSKPKKTTDIKLAATLIKVKLMCLSPHVNYKLHPRRIINRPKTHSNNNRSYLQQDLQVKVPITDLTPIQSLLQVSFISLIIIFSNIFKRAWLCKSSLTKI